MTILEVMERTGARDPELVRAYVNDALEEIQDMIPDKTTFIKLNVAADVRLYSFPSAMLELLGVYRRYDDAGRYVRIGRVQNVEIEEPTSSVGSLSSVVTDIVVI